MPAATSDQFPDPTARSQAGVRHPQLWHRDSTALYRPRAAATRDATRSTASHCLSRGWGRERVT